MLALHMARMLLVSFYFIKNFTLLTKFFSPCPPFVVQCLCFSMSCSNTKNILVCGVNSSLLNIFVAHFFIKTYPIHIEHQDAPNTISVSSLSHLSLLVWSPSGMRLFIGICFISIQHFFLLILFLLCLYDFIYYLLHCFHNDKTIKKHFLAFLHYGSRLHNCYLDLFIYL